MAMETTLGSMDMTTIVSNCPVCRRIMWTRSTCRHGVPLPAPKEDSSQAPPPEEAERRDDGHKPRGRHRK